MAASKVVYTSTLASGTSTWITNGNTKNTQSVVTKKDNPYIVIDLGVSTTISSVVLYTAATKATALNGFAIMAMTDWRTCYSTDIFTSGNTKCGTLNVTTATSTVVLNTTTSCKGRFIALAKHTSPQVAIRLSEIQIFGTKSNPSDVIINQNPFERQCGVNNNEYLALDLAIGKTCYGSKLAGPASDYALSFATDGLQQFNEQCFSTYGPNNYFVLDLGASVNISFVRIQSTYWDIYQIGLFDIVITNTFIPCALSQIFTYPICSGALVENTPSDIWEFKTDGSCNGQYFILRSKDTISNRWLKICEIEVYGNVAGSAAVSSVSYENSCSLTSDGSNVAFGKTSVALYDNHLDAITDGVLDSGNVWEKCYYSYWLENNFVVINLGAFYTLDAIKVWNSQDSIQGNQFTINILVGERFRQQYQDSDLQSFKAVASNLPTFNSFTLAKFDSTDHIVAQYIMIQKPNNDQDTFFICEVEVFGTLLSSRLPDNIRPTFVDQPIVQTSVNDFPIASALRQGASYAYFMQYSAPVHTSNPNAEGILWPPSGLDPYVVAGTYGLGRFIACGKYGYILHYLKSDFDPIFANNVYNWLSPTKGVSANIIFSTEISSGILGDIVYFDTDSPLTNAQQQLLLDLLQAGNVSVVIEMTYWSELAYGSHRANYDFLLRALQIDFSSDYISDDDQQIPLIDDDYTKNDHGKMLSRLSKIEQSLQYLQTNGLTTIQSLSSFPEYMMTSNISATMHAIVQKYYDLVKYICPAVSSPMHKGEDEVVILVFNLIIRNQAMAPYGLKAPCVDLFPGDIIPQSSVPSVTASLSIIAQNDIEIHSTSLYLLPGQSLSYSTLDIQGQWMMAIGCHTDELYYEPNDPYNVWTRYPIVHSGFVTINSDNGILYSPFGGVVWIKNMDTTGYLNIQIGNVIKSPSFNIRDDNSDIAWQQGINNAGPWTEVMGQYVILSAPSDRLRGFSADDIRTVLKVWDTALSLMHNLAGTNPDSIKRERVVIDIQIAYGYGHSGYPIMTVYSWFDHIFNYDVITVPNCWGVVHEFGHRRQEWYFTFSGTTEVTVNIFADFIWSYVYNVSFFSGNHERFTLSTQERVVNYFANGAQFSDWQQTADVAYVIYGQLGYYYGFGLYQRVFTNYTVTNPSPTDDQEIIDLWVTTTSFYAGNNLVPLFTFWGIPVSSQVGDALSTLPCFLPQDVIAGLVPDRFAAISAQYNNACSSTPFQGFNLRIPNNLITSRPNDIQIS